MRILALAAAALLTAGIAAAPASAEGFPPSHGHGWHNGHGHGWHGGHRQRCQWVWRHHHRVRRCR